MEKQERINWLKESISEKQERLFHYRCADIEEKDLFPLVESIEEDQKKLTEMEREQ